MNNTNNELINIPRLPPEASSLARASSNPWVQRANSHVELLNGIASKLPREYKWKFRNVEAFTSEVEVLAKIANDALPVNRFVWADHIQSCETYSLMSIWRAVDLARGCVWAIARGEVVAAALLSRSGIETAAQFADLARRTVATLIGTTREDGKGRLLDPEIDLRKTVVASEDFERLILKTLFATRLDVSEEVYKATNALTLIQNASRIEGQELVLGMYEQLCEVAHPNFPGRSIYVLSVQAGEQPGNETRTIGPGLGPSARQIAETTLGGLSWSCGTSASAFDLMSKAMQAIWRRLQSS